MGQRQDGNIERALTDVEDSGHPTPSGPRLRPVRRLACQALRTPPPDTFGAWRQPRDDTQRRLGWTGLIWSALLCLAGIGAGLATLP